MNRIQALVRAAKSLALFGALAFAVASCANTMRNSTERHAEHERVAGPAGMLHVDDGGSGGLPVIFLHSFAGSTRHWSAQLAHLRKERRAIAIDLRGHGQSDPPRDGVYTVKAFAQDLGAVVDALELKRFVLVGSSMGASTAIEYASTHPERVAGLLLVGAPGRVPPDQATQILLALEKDYDAMTRAYWDTLLSGARPEVRAQLANAMQRVPKAESMAIIRAMFAYDPVAPLQRYTGPKLAIITTHNNSPYELHELAQGLPSKLMDGTSHWPHLDKPTEFDRSMDEFLASVH